jgi:hypothetical protein
MVDAAHHGLRKRLGPCERKEIMARVVQVCKDWLFVYLDHLDTG